jgi:TrmH family RNA methyltransferase
MVDITSHSNAKIKFARTLRKRKGRKSTGNFLVEGVHHVGAAFEAEVHLESLFYAPELLDSQYARELIESASESGIPCYSTSKEIFTTLAEKENPQGIIAVVDQQQVDLIDLNASNFPWGVACVAPQDPGNLGAIVRTIDAVGASGLILLDGGVDPYHPTAVRASMGALFRHPVVSASFTDFENWAGSKGYNLYGTSAHGSLDFQQISEFKRPLILLLGDERQGLTLEQAEVCGWLIQLPMHGKVTSLNLAVAAGVMLYGMLENMEDS